MKYSILLFLCCFFSVNLLMAATDGVIGTISSGLSGISLNIPKLIRISNFTDFTFNWASGAINANHDLVVSVNFGATPATRLYSMIGAGSGPDNEFSIDNGSATLPYRVWFNDSAGTGGRVRLVPNEIELNQLGANKPIASSTPNANLSIRFTNAVLNAAEGGTYTGTLSLIVSPQ